MSSSSGDLRATPGRECLKDVDLTALPDGSTEPVSDRRAYPQGAFTVKPYWKAYFQRYGEKPNHVLCARMGKVLKQLEREFAPGLVLERFTRYLEGTPPEYFSAPHFAETWAAWGPPEPWVIALGDDWTAAMHGLAPLEDIMQLRELVATHPFSQVQVHWQHYLAAHQNGESKFASVARFAMTFNAWAPPSRSAISLPYVSRYLTADEADARAGIPIRDHEAAE